MCALLAILREVRDPRDANARHDLAEVLFIALAATLCGAKSCVEIADFAEGREDASTCRTKSQGLFSGCRPFIVAVSAPTGLCGATSGRRRRPPPGSGLRARVRPP